MSIDSRGDRDRGGPTRRPNIVLILSDDHAAHAISAYGSRVNATPQIDRIAAGGMRLTNAFCTNAICTPSRAAMLTGTYNHVNGVTTLASVWDARQPSFVSALHRAGYQTAIVGKCISATAACPIRGTSITGRCCPARAATMTRPS